MNILRGTAIQGYIEISLNYRIDKTDVDSFQQHDQFLNRLTILLTNNKKILAEKKANNDSTCIYLYLIDCIYQYCIGIAIYDYLCSCVGEW